MAVIQTGDIFKSFTFDGQDSRTYGIYITGEAVYNAPERSVEMISIPGRNGAYVLDNGRFENIEVTYPAGCFGNTEADFRDAISNIRNMLCSRKGYVRLTDGYNPNEYRLAVYKSGLEVTPAQLLAGEFDITFDCKPQRFLTSGETAVAVTSGGTVTNPTRFPAYPLLKVDGYGDIVINGKRLTVNEAYLGNVTIEGETSWSSAGYANQIYLGALNTGDTFTINDITLNVRYTDVHGGFSRTHTQISASTFDESNIVFSDSISFDGNACRTLNISLHTGAIGFVKGTSKSGTLTASVVLKDVDHAATATETITLSYSYSSGLLTLAATLPAAATYWSITANETGFRSITGFSTINANSQAYIDLDIGEAWKVVNGTAVEVNGIITLPPELPTLAPGSNTITYANTITGLTVTPRWWII